MRLFASSVVFVLGAACLLAQSDRGTITGTVADPSGAVVPNATITIKNADTGQVYDSGTSNTGNFTVPVPVGRYTLTVTVTGFKKFVRENLQVVVATDTRQDVVLQVGQQTETVTVTEAAPMLKTESGEMSHTVTADQLDSLPIMFLGGSTGAGTGAIRNPLNLAELLPGVEYGSNFELRVNGLPSSSEAIRIEGQDSTNGLWRELTTNTQGGVDAIQEVSVQTSNFAAEYGQAAGGYFNFTMKSGTNQFHGSGYDYFVNEVFNAGLPWTNAGTTNSLKRNQLIRNPVRQNDYGFTVGGPVAIPKVYDGHNKTFFFFNFEQFRQNKTVNNTIYTVPTADYRKGIFTAAEGTKVIGTDSAGQSLFNDQIFDPTTNVTQPDGSITRTPFLNNVVPPTSIDPTFAKVQAYFPQPNLSGLVNNYQVPAYSNFTHYTNPSFKVDESLSPTIKLSAYYSYLVNNSPNADGIQMPLPAIAPTHNVSHTVRVNYDQTIRPTLLLHLGIGYLQTYNPSIVPNTSGFNEATSLGLNGYFNNTFFPNIGGLNAAVNGGTNLPIGGGGLGATNTRLWEEKPTGNASMTWVKGNHSFKFGGELYIDGFPDHSLYRTNGLFGVSGNETADPWQNGQFLGGSTTGFPYASFFLGQIDNIALSPPTQTKLGNHGIGLYAQDSWKVTRKLTVDYGLRYDYQTYLREQYGRMQDGAFNTLNTKIDRNGSVVYEATCHCNFAQNYPLDFGPRLGVAYQLDSKTVLRGGTGLSYSTTANNAFLSYNVADYYSFSPNGYGQAVITNLAAGNPYPNLTWPNFDQNKFPFQTTCPVGQSKYQTSTACYNPQSPFISQDKNTRPTRVFQWSIGVQREVQRNVVVEANYVGNRGAYETAPNLASLNYDALTVQNLQGLGININSATDRSLLTLPLNSPAAYQRGFGLPYVGFPNTLPLEQSLRPEPQWSGVPPFLGPPIGDSWYDSLQTKVTKRYSHGLEIQGSYTFSKELILGANSDTNYFTPGQPLVNDVFNRMLQKQLSSLGHPNAVIISGTYVTPGLEADSAGMKILSNVVRGWSIGAVMRYQSGILLQTPASNNQLMTELGRGAFSGPLLNNPAIWGGGATFQNVVPGAGRFAIQNPNCGCFDPRATLALSPGAWSDAPAGQFGTDAPYYNGYRWMREPAENMSFGRIFRMGKEGRYQLQVRAEFQNVFNRIQLPMPSAGNPTATVSCSGGACPTNGVPIYTGGFGYMNTTGGGGDQPRSGQMVARFTF